MSQAESPFISVVDLKAAIDRQEKLVLLDARFDLAAADPAVLAAAERIPGAIAVDVNSEFAGASGPKTGRLPLPEIADLQRDARRWGIDAETTVVIYDEAKGTLAARAWWVLRWAGVVGARILDGGFAAWCAGASATTREAVFVRRGGITLSAGHLPVIGPDGASALADIGKLVDGRARDAYVGQQGNTATGHIPGALSLPASSLQSSDGRVKSPEAIEAALTALAIDASRRSGLGAYCGSGVAAAYDVAALQTVGLEVALYPGSWSEWVKDPSRPVAWGEQQAAVASSS